MRKMTMKSPSNAMQLFNTDTDASFGLLKYISTNNKWEIGMRPMLFGIRVSGNPVGSYCYTFDYCAGNNPVFAIELFQTMLVIFEALPEDIDEKEVLKILPSYTIKPIDRDPRCWKELQQLAITLSQRLLDNQNPYQNRG